MMRSIVHVVIALATFFIGTASVGLIPDTSRTPVPVPNVQKVEFFPARLSEPTVPSISAKPVSQFILDYDPREFNPRGDYYILGKTPKEFREFELLELAVEERDGKASGEVTLATNYYGNNKDYYITTGNGDYIISGKVTKKRLTFVATTISDEDFEFRFDGHFLVEGRVAAAGRKQAVLKGKLVKLKNGIKIAESEVKFRVEYLGC